MKKEAYKYVRNTIPQQSRWATKEEIAAKASKIELNAEHYPVGGLPLLSDGVTAYVDGSDTHTLIYGATGSKKTRIFCMPMINIFAKAGESYVVTDPKGELYATTSGLAKENGYKLVVLDFRDVGAGDCWNPLTMPYDMWHNGMQDEAGLLLMDLAAGLASELKENNDDMYWPESAQSLANANLLTMMEACTKEQANLTTLAQMSNTGAVNSLRKLSEYMREDSMAYINYKSTVGMRAENTVSCIMSMLATMIRLFSSNRRLSAMLSKNSFEIKNFGREKTAVYIIIPDEKSTYNFIITTFIKQVYEILISEAQKENNRKLPVRVNFVLDEFCNIPAIPDMSSMISAARSRNMRFYLIVQSLHQLKRKYGDDADTIKGNCDNWVFLTSRELALLNEISELCGELTDAYGNKRRLISVSELQRLTKGWDYSEALIIHGREYPIISEMPDINLYTMFGKYEKVPYFRKADDDYAVLVVSQLLEEIDEQRKIAPFASEEHKLYQALAILLSEHGMPITRYGKCTEDVKSILSFNEGGKYGPLKRAYDRIAALLGVEYAEAFFENPPYRKEGFEFPKASKSNFS